METTSNPYARVLHRAIDEFALTEQHLTLLANAYVEWQFTETGAPAIDPKRPYGNSDVAADVAELFGFPVDDDGEYTDEQLEKALELHHQTLVALEIVLQTRSFTPGLYRRTRKNEYERGTWLRQ